VTGPTRIESRFNHAAPSRSSEEESAMKRSTFGALMASAVVGLAGTAMAEHHEGEAKACYRPECGKSVEGHEGKCGGTKVEELEDQASCEAAGGAWVSAKEAKKLKDQG
jgi:hypothetical protein